MAALPEYADALLRYLGAERGGRKMEVRTFFKDGYKVRQLVITSMEHVGWIVGLHHARPDHGVGALRIRCGPTRTCNMLLVAGTPVTPFIITHKAPTGSVDGILWRRASTRSRCSSPPSVGINGASGDIRDSDEM